jgi:hypothetical protein
VSWKRDWLNLEKLEIGADGHINLDATVEGVYPGLDVIFSGNSIDKSDLRMTYRCEGRKRSDFAAITHQICSDCETIAERLRSNYAAMAHRICSDCEAISQQ